MPRSVKATIQGLLQLREIDDKVALLERRIEDGPRIVRLRGGEVAAAEEAIERKRKEIIAFKLEFKDKEIQLKKKEEEIKKQELFLLTAKKMSNVEYSTHQNQIRRLKDQVGGLEEEILEGMDRSEQHARKLAELEGELAIRKKELQDFAREIDEDIASYKGEIEEHRKKREELALTIDFEAAQLYDRILKARDDAAIVPVEVQTCGGCHMTVTPNDLARLRGMAEMVLCKSCQRILYLPDTVE